MDKEDKKWKRRFIAFLKKNGIYEKWIYNIKVQHPIRGSWWYCFTNTIYANRCSEGINCAFYWADTKEGQSYWSDFDRMWKKRIGLI